MPKYLKNLYAQKILVDDVEQEIKNKKNEFDNIKLDFIVILLYANFVKEIDNIIINKLKSKNNFHKNYINFLHKQNQKMHRGISKKHFKALLEDIFNVERSKIISDHDWNIFCNFMEFRHSIAHCLPNYQSNKNNLIQNIGNTETLINVFENILTSLDNIKKVKLKP